MVTETWTITGQHRTLFFSRCL